MAVRCACFLSHSLVAGPYSCFYVFSYLSIPSFTFGRAGSSLLLGLSLVAASGAALHGGWASRGGCFCRGARALGRRLGSCPAAQRPSWTRGLTPCPCTGRQISATGPPGTSPLLPSCFSLPLVSDFRASLTSAGWGGERGQ